MKLQHELLLKEYEKKAESEKTALKMNECNNTLGAMYLRINRTQIAYSLMGEMQIRDKQNRVR